MSLIVDFIVRFVGFMALFGGVFFLSIMISFVAGHYLGKDRGTGIGMGVMVVGLLILGLYYGGASPSDMAGPRR